MERTKENQFLSAVIGFVAGDALGVPVEFSSRIQRKENPVSELLGYCVLKAVNLGDDTDTVGAVAGGLAGLYYGIEKIPAEWTAILPKKDWITELVQKMI